MARDGFINVLLLNVNFKLLNEGQDHNIQIDELTYHIYHKNSLQFIKMRTIIVKFSYNLMKV